MKVVKLTLLFVVFAMCAQAQAWESGDKDKSDVVKEKLRGKVKTMAVTGFTVERREGKLKKGREIHTDTSRYNDKGYLLEYTSSSGDDTVQD